MLLCTSEHGGVDRAELFNCLHFHSTASGIDFKNKNENNESSHLLHAVWVRDY